MVRRDSSGVWDRQVHTAITIFKTDKQQGPTA